MRSCYITLLCGILLMAVSGCHPREKSQSASSEKAEVEVLKSRYDHADSLYRHGRIDTAAFNSFINSAMAMAEQSPKADIAPEMLYKAGIGSMILAKSAATRNNRDETARYAKQALKIFYDFQELYPDHENAKYCYYQRGVIYDDILGDYTSADDQYRDFINRYPEDSLASQLRDYLKILGKTESQLEEIMHLE